MVDSVKDDNSMHWNGVKYDKNGRTVAVAVGSKEV